MADTKTKYDTTTEHCLNCDAPLSGLYCSQCGQKRAERLTIRFVISEAFGHLTNLDFGFLRTVVSLTRNPGSTCRQYVEGKRQRVFNPLKYVLVMATLYALLVNLFHIDMSAPFGRFESPEEIALANLIVSLRGYLLFIILIPVAAIQRLLFRKEKFGIVECYVFGFFTSGHLLWLSIILAVSGQFSTLVGFSSLWLLGWAFMIWAVIGFYDKFTIGAGTKAFFLYLIFVFFFMLINILTAQIAFMIGLVT